MKLNLYKLINLYTSNFFYDVTKSAFAHLAVFALRIFNLYM